MCVCVCVCVCVYTVNVGYTTLTHSMAGLANTPQPVTVVLPDGRVWCVADDRALTSHLYITRVYVCVCVRVCVLCILYIIIINI
jgi:hypothetical protein